MKRWLYQLRFLCVSPCKEGGDFGVIHVSSVFIVGCFFMFIVFIYTHTLRRGNFNHFINKTPQYFNFHLQQQTAVCVLNIQEKGVLALVRDYT